MRFALQQVSISICVWCAMTHPEYLIPLVVVAVVVLIANVRGYGRY
jgi:hypothetical protein